MKYYLIAGEASGDLHGSKLMRGLKGSDPEADFRYFGGDLMQAEGGTLVQHYRQTAVMGLFKVIANLGKISRNLKKCRQDILKYRPDVLILIDYSGFNLRIARWAKPAGFRVVYYISPKVWVWNKRRVYTIKENVDRMYVILPFEVDFYHGYDYPVEYVGNPVLDAVEERASVPESRKEFLERNGLGNTPLIALLAGSRREEIRHCLPEMLAAARDFPEWQFVVAGAPGISREFYDQYITEPGISLVFDQTYELLMQAEAAVVTSGTATLETALFGVPEAVVYKMSKATYYIGKQFIKPEFFSLVNLIMGREVVKEILQLRVSEKISAELRRILKDHEYREQMLSDFRELKERMGKTGAPERLASRVISFLSETKASG
jgi:lipid-A-disaccharide synthase